MYKRIILALKKALEFKDIKVTEITRVEYSVGFIWFKNKEDTYLIDITKCDFDLDKKVKKEKRDID